jgi:hypothetical protein
MASKSNDKSTDRKQTGRDRLPFEPTGNRKKQDKKPSPATPTEKTNSPSRSTPNKRSGAVDNRIPEVVSKRMIKRMALFCGIPTALGVSTFLVSYLVVTNDLFKLPPTAVLLVSLGFFGLGVLGLTYGVLSASWDEKMAGSRLGWTEFRLNFGRMTDAWRNRESS